MKLVSTPYRWLPRMIWKNISHWGWDIRNGCRNLVTFFEAVWWFRSWDWTGMVSLLEVSAKEMHQCQSAGHHTTAEREAKRLLIVRELCKRLIAEEYFEKAGYGSGGAEWHNLPDHRRTQIAKHASYMSYQDAAYLGQMFKFVQHWWD